MRRWTGCLILLGLLASTACSPWADGCDAQPLVEPLDPASIGPRAVEFYLPAERLAGLGAELLQSLSTQAADQVAVDLPAASIALDAQQALAHDQIRLAFTIVRLDLAASQGGLILEVELEPIEVGLPLTLFEADQPIAACNASLVIPARSAGLPVVLVEDELGAAGLRVDGAPRFTGVALSVQVGDGCPLEAAGALGADLASALDAGLQQAMPQLSETLLASVSAALGVDRGGAGRLGEAFKYWLRADPGSTSLAPEGSRLGLAGGFETQRAACVPPALTPAPPTPGEPAPFADLLPEAQEPYGLGLSISRAYIEQALASAQRAGSLCRRSGAGDVAGVDLTGALPSLAGLGRVDAVRAAVWPQSALRVAFGQGDPAAGERLPRLLLTLPELYLDVYARVDGADLRVLGIRGDVTLAVVGRLDGHELRLSLAEAQVAGLEVEFAELVTEQAGELRAAARQIVYEVGAALIDALPPIELDLPTSAGPELLEVRQIGEHVILYF